MTGGFPAPPLPRVVCLGVMWKVATPPLPRPSGAGLPDCLASLVDAFGQADALASARGPDLLGRHTDLEGGKPDDDVHGTACLPAEQNQSLDPG